MPMNRSVYVVLTVILIIIAAGIGFIAGQMSAPMTPASKEKVTVTQKIIETQTITAQVAQTTRQPTREELLAPIIEAAKKEGKLLIYTGLDVPSAEPLIKAFKAKYPFINIEYVELDSAQAYNRYLSERAAGAPTADVIEISSEDLIVDLVRKGLPQPYKVTNYDELPDSAKIGDGLAYVISYKLAAPIYNTQKIPKDLAPKSYADVIKLLTQRRDLFPPKSVVGPDPTTGIFWLLALYYMYKTDPDLIKGLWTAAAPIGVIVQKGSGNQIEMVRNGQALVSLMLNANYAFREAANDSRIGVFIPNDLVFLGIRAMFITKEAQHPNAAKLFLDFIMSKEGQDALAKGGEVIVVGDNKYYPQLSLSYIAANTKKLVVVKYGDPWLEELLKPEVRNSFIAMWKSWWGGS